MSDSSLQNKTIVCYLDILGYTNMVKTCHKETALVEDLERIMRKSTIGLRAKAHKKAFHGTKYQDYWKQIIGLIDVKFISDSVIFTLPLDNISFSHENYTEKETKANCISTLLYFVSMFCTLFISHTGHCIRGGISIGKHYEKYSDENKSLFIFSPVYIAAYELEKKAKLPRVLLDKVLHDYFTEIKYPEFDRFFFQDSLASTCFDLYAHLKKDTTGSECVLKDIKKGIELNLWQNQGNNVVLSKLIYFANYHNAKVTNIQSSSAEAIMNILKTK